MTIPELLEILDKFNKEYILQRAKFSTLMAMDKFILCLQQEQSDIESNRPITETNESEL